MAKRKSLAAEIHNQDDVLQPGSDEGRAREILGGEDLSLEEKLRQLGEIWAAGIPAAGPGPVVDPLVRPLLSVCIPTYERAEYLFALLLTLAGEFARTPGLGARVEVVVVDNASTDLTASVVELARGSLPQLHYHCHELNIGPDPNFFRALALARGEYQWLLGDDELVLPGGLARIVAELDAHAPDHLYLNFQMVTIRRELLNADYLHGLNRQPHSLLGLLKKIGYVRGFALISAHVFRTTPFRAHCEPDLVEALSFYPLLPVLLKAFAATGNCRQLFEPSIAHRVNNRFPDPLAVNHTRVLGLVRVLNLLMTKYGVLTPGDVREIFEYASENHTGWYFVDELARGCEQLLAGKYNLPIEDCDSIQTFFGLVGGPSAARLLQDLVAIRFNRDKPIMARAAITTKSARFSALFLVEGGADLRALPARLPRDERFRFSVELICVMVNWPLSREVVECFDQVIAMPQHLVGSRVDLFNLLGIQARAEELLFLPVCDEASGQRAVTLLLETYAAAGTLQPGAGSGRAAPLPARLDLALGMTGRPSAGSLTWQAIAGAVQRGRPIPELQGLGISRRLFFRFRGCDLVLYKDRPSLGLLDLAFRARREVAWEITGNAADAPPPPAGLLAAAAASYIYFFRSLRTLPIWESELVRPVRLRLGRVRRLRPRSRLSWLGARIGYLLVETFGFAVPWGRELRSAWRTVKKRFVKGPKR